MTTPTEDDGFVTPMNTAERFKPLYGDAAFNAFVKIDLANFHLMLAYKLDDQQNLEAARARLAEMIEVIDAALPSEAMSDDEVAKIMALQAARADRRGEG